MPGLLFIAFVFLLLGHLSLRDRVAKLESKKDERSQIPPGARGVSPLPPPEEVERFEVGTTHRLTPTFSVEATTRAKNFTEQALTNEIFIVRWFRTQTLIKVGSIFFFLGASWFVSYAINEGWLPRELRIFLGFLLAGGIYVFAYVRSNTSLVQYGVLTALGSGVAFVTILAGSAVFGLYPPLLMLCFIGGSVAYAVFVARRIGAEWLAVLAALAGLCAPFFVSLQGAIFLPLYLFILSSGLLIAGQGPAWRTVLLVLSIGVSWHQMGLVEHASRMTEWFFAALFSSLFFAAVTVTIVSTKTLHRLDVVTLIITSMTYIAFVTVLATHPALAMFVATVVVSLVGYLLYTRGLSAKIIAVYLAFAVIGVLIGTSFLFSGHSLILAYAIECAGAFFLVTHLGLPERFVVITAGTFVLPVLLSIQALSSLSWQEGIWHADALSVYAVWAMLWSSALWLTHKPGVALYLSSRTISTILAVTGFFYGYVVCMVVMGALFIGTAAYVMTYIAWAMLSLIVFFYAVKNNFPIQAIRTTTWSIVIPLVFSTVSLTAMEWQTGVHHFSAFGVWSMIGVMCVSILLTTQEYCKDFDTTLRKINGFFIFITTLFMFAALRVTWDSFFSNEVADVVTYASYGGVLYLIASVFILVRAPQFWIRVAVLSFLFPLALSLNSFSPGGWSDNEILFHVTGLFVSGALTSLLVLGLRRNLYLVAEKDTRQFLVRLSRFLEFSVLGIGMAAIWSLAHSLIAPAQAISSALLIYTATGLVAYLLGTKRHTNVFRYMGVVLLSVVVVRLVSVDVWHMEIFWRIITFLGVGTLFILAAIFERSEELR